MGESWEGLLSSAPGPGHRVFRVMFWPSWWPGTGGARPNVNIREGCIIPNWFERGTWDWQWYDDVMHWRDTRGDCLLVIISIQLKVKWSCFVLYFISHIIAGESHEMKVLICQLGPSHKHRSVHSDPVSAWWAASHNGGADLIIPTNLTQSDPYRQTDSQTLNTCIFYFSRIKMMTQYPRWRRTLS